MKYYVYLHYIGDNTFYVGKGSGNRAHSKHNRSLKWREFVGNRKYEVEIIKLFESEKEAFAYETKITQYYKDLGQCATNVCIGANKDNETKRKMSKAHVGKIFSDEHKKKLSENHARLSGENHPMFGVHRYGESNPYAKQITVSINGVAYTTGCKIDMKKLLLEKHNIKASGRFISGQVPKKYKDIVDYIKVNDDVIYKK